MSGEARGTCVSETRTSMGHESRPHRSGCGSRQGGKIAGSPLRIWNAITSTCAARTLRCSSNGPTGWAEGARHPGYAGILATLALLGTGEAVQAEIIRASSIYVIDGDTVEVSGQRYRLVGFDTPETYHAQCDYELALGQKATRRVRELLASGRIVEIAVLPGQDRYGRGLARLFVEGVDVGMILMTEGFARQYDGGRREGWC